MTEDRIGTVTHYFTRIGVATIKVERPVNVGEELHIVGAHDDLHFRVDSMEADHAPIPQAKPGQEVGVKLPERAHEHSVVYRVAS